MFHYTLNTRNILSCEFIYMMKTMCNCLDIHFLITDWKIFASFPKCWGFNKSVSFFYIFFAYWNNLIGSFHACFYSSEKVKWKVSKYQSLHAANLSNHIRKNVNLLTLQECFNSKPRKAHERFTRFNPALILKKFIYRVKTRKWELLSFYQNWEIVALAVGDLEWSPKISQSFASSKSLAYVTCAMIDFLATFGGTLQKTGYSKCANETLARLHQCS